MGWSFCYFLCCGISLFSLFCSFIVCVYMCISDSLFVVAVCPYCPYCPYCLFFICSLWVVAFYFFSFMHVSLGVQCLLFIDWRAQQK
ncbi:hypothetical protein BDF14DRAFT_1835657 [Spinellus fusiger]|nr:hypothetical protein BDF14DRAFT_1835657 [Spinellus fusiger]